MWVRPGRLWHVRSACTAARSCNWRDWAPRPFRLAHLRTSRRPVRFCPEDLIDHCVPADKKLHPEWLRSLTERGDSQLVSGSGPGDDRHADRRNRAGQLYITGDGRLVHWDIFNLPAPVYLYPDKPAAPAEILQQGFAIQVQQGNKSELRPLDAAGFPGVAFRGEYPQATVKYADEAFPVEAVLEAFSPFIPLNADDSTLPATVMQFTLTNKSDSACHRHAWPAGCRTVCAARVASLCQGNL